MNERKSHPSTQSSSHVSGSRLAVRGRKSRAASAGLSVSELKVEMIVETAIVSANWRKNCPTIPERKAQGMNTALSTRPTAITGPGNFVHGLERRSPRGQPVLDMMLDRLDDDDGIVDDDADRQHQAEQGQIVDAEAHDRHGAERADDGDGDGDQGNDGRPPALQKHEHHDGHQNDGIAQRFEDLVIDSRMKGVVS